MGDGQELYTLLDGTELTGNELTAMYQYNKINHLLPVAGYFCPDCNHEISDIYIKQDFVCPYCKKEKEN